MAAEHECPFPRGAVRRLRVSDFMSFVGTYSLECGPRVNLITGTNGSGKSSLVTALCVGLGGRMKSLGRQTRPEQLIRRGSNAFEVEVTLSGGPQQPDVVVLRRTAIGTGGRRRAAPSGGGGGGGRRPAKQRRTEGGGGAAAGGNGGGGGEGVEEAEDEEDGEGGAEAGVHTSWTVNGLHSSEGAVRQLARDMGIHLDNLCCFLPQERVAEFANLGAADLLAATEEAIGDGHLLRQHEQLRKVAEALRGKREELARTRERLARVEAEQKSNEPEYERLQRRNALKRTVEQMRLKLLWLDVEAQDKEAAKARSRRARVDAHLRAARQLVADSERPLNASKQAQAAAKRAEAALLREAGTRESAAAAAQAEVAALEEALKRQELELEGLRARSERWAADLARARSNLERVQGERAALPAGPNAAHQARLEAIAAELVTMAGEAGAAEVELKGKREEVRATEAQIQRLQEAANRRRDRDEQRLRRLEEAQPGSRQLWEWIKQTSEAGGFQGLVLGPLLMHVGSVHDKVWCSMLEQAIGRKELAAVVTEHKSDEEKVLQYLSAQRSAASQPNRRGNRFMHKTMCPGTAADAIAHPLGEPQQYEAYGITHTLDQLLEAPLLIKTALCHSRNLHTAYVGTNATERTPGLMGRLFAETRVRCVYCPEASSTMRVSMYDSTFVREDVTTLRPARLLADDVGTHEDAAAETRQMEVLQQARADLQRAAEVMEARVAERREAIRRLHDEKAALQASRKHQEEKVAHLRRKEADHARDVQRLQAGGDPLASADSLRAQLRRTAEQLLAKAAATLRLRRQQHGVHRRLTAAQLAAAAGAAGVAPLQAALDRAQEACGAATAAATAAAAAAERAEERLRQAKARVAQELGAGGPSEEQRGAWARMPGDPDELEKALAEKQAEMEAAQAAMRSDEAQVLEAWARRAAEIVELRGKDGSGSREVEAAEADVRAKTDAWLPELRRHVASISAAVSAHFASIKCAGEVALREEGDRFGEYAVEIRVKYRPDEPMRPLDRNRHSGGERSVATMLYIMALQGVTATPFRVVDEINQGMDSRNERRVFNLLVEASSRPDTPQCFLLTPKIISGLTFNEHVLLQSIFCLPAASVAGPW